MLVTDGQRASQPLVDLIVAAAAGGVDAIYLRDVDLPVIDLLQLKAQIAERVPGQVSFLVNGNSERAQTAGMGLQLRERDPMPRAIRFAIGDNLLIGRSVHSAAGAATSAGADFLLAGHVFPSRSKPGQPPLGRGGLAAIVAAAPCPVLAIGGITAERIPDVIDAGAIGVAVIGAIVESDDPQRAAAQLRAAVDLALAK